MASRNYRSSSSPSEDWMWPFVVVLIALLLGLAGLPAIILGFLGQRYTSTHLAWGYKLWLLLLFPSCALLFFFWQRGLDQLFIKEILEFTFNARHYQTDFGHWHLGLLWSEIWPVWLHTLVAIPVAAIMIEGTQQAAGQTARQLQRHRQQQLRHATKAHQRARKRTSKPERLPDSIGGEMVMGVPIKDDRKENE